VILLWPVLFAPVTADDRYWYLEVPDQTQLSYLEAVQLSINEIPRWLDTGRVAPLAFLARRILLLSTFKFSVATSTPLFVSQGLAKVLLLASGIASCLAFVRSLRWRSSDARLIRIGARQLTMIGVALIALTAVGAQAHSQFRNGWISYPALTYGAVTVVFGSGALVAWSARRVAEHRRGAIPIGITAMVVLSVALNVSYELYYVAVPLGLAALLVFPYSGRRGDPAARRARVLIGGTLTLGFITVFLWLRQIIAARCALAECYVGTELSLNRRVLPTLWNNFFTSVPGLSHERFLADLEEFGASSRWPDPATTGVVLTAVLLAFAVLVVWMLLSTPTKETEAAIVGAQQRLLIAASTVVLGVGIGAALLMSLSLQAQEVIASIGFPYRHTVLTWTAIALAVTLLSLAFTLTGSPLRRRLAPLALVSVMIVAIAFGLPRNLVSNQVYRNLAGNRAIADIHWEVVTGDVNENGDLRRCQTYDRAEASISTSWLGTRLMPAADSLFRTLYKVPYCSIWPKQ
jgi:hypothetical protein